MLLPLQKTKVAAISIDKLTYGSAFTEYFPLDISRSPVLELNIKECSASWALKVFIEDGEIISRDTIVKSINAGKAYRIICDGKVVGGLVLRIEGVKGDLDLLFVSPKAHSKGIGYSAWCKVEEMYPEIEVWETCTPYFEKRNIHFYINKKAKKDIAVFSNFPSCQTFRDS